MSNKSQKSAETSILGRVKSFVGSALHQDTANEPQALNEVKTIEVVLLRDSALGQGGTVVTIPQSDVEAYKLHGIVDDHPDAVAYVKSQEVKSK